MQILNCGHITSKMVELTILPLSVKYYTLGSLTKELIDGLWKIEDRNLEFYGRHFLVIHYDSPQGHLGSFEADCKLHFLWFVPLKLIR